MKKDINIVVRLLKAGSNERRIRILKLLLDGREYTVLDISNRLNMSITTTSKHLNKLEGMRLLKKRRTKQWVWYSINKDERKKFNMRFLEFLKKVL